MQRAHRVALMHHSCPQSGGAMANEQGETLSPGSIILSLRLKANQENP